MSNDRPRFSPILSPGPVPDLMLVWDARGSLIHVRNRKTNDCLGCIEVGLFELLKTLILAEPRRETPKRISDDGLAFCLALMVGDTQGVRNEQRMQRDDVSTSQCRVIGMVGRRVGFESDALEPSEGAAGRLRSGQLLVSDTIRSPASASAGVSLSCSASDPDEAMLDRYRDIVDGTFEKLGLIKDL
jgi:hypothetical protein